MRTLGALGLAALAVACGNRPRTPPPPVPPIASVAIIPATTPQAFALANLSAAQFIVPIAATIHWADSRQKAEVFTAGMRKATPDLGAEFSEAVAAALRAKGLQVTLLSDVKRVPDDPDNIDYAKFEAPADAVLHVAFSSVGLQSPRSSTDYLPQVNARGTLFVKGREDHVWDDVVYYGVDARPGNSWAIAADPRFAYPSFDAVMADLPGVRQMFGSASQAIAQRMADQIAAAIPKRATVAAAAPVPMPVPVPTGAGAPAPAAASAPR